jgi:hypothetical protein
MLPPLQICNTFLMHHHTPSARILNATKIHIYIKSKLECMEGDIGRDAKRSRAPSLTL